MVPMQRVRECVSIGLESRVSRGFTGVLIVAKGVDHADPRRFEMALVARDQGEAVDKGRGCDKQVNVEVAYVPRQSTPDPGCGRVNPNDPVRERGRRLFYPGGKVTRKSRVSASPLR